MWRRSLAPLLFVVAAAVFFAGNGLRGVDFGDHWDEPKLVASVSKSMQTGVLLPGWYNYPSLSYLISLAALTPEVARAVAQGPDLARYAGAPRVHAVPTVDTSAPAADEAARRRLYLRDAATREPFLLRARALFILLTSLTIPWVFLLTWRIRDRPWEGVVAALLVAGSWEAVYHARWAAPDALLMMFGALTMLCVVSGLRSPAPGRWLTAAAIAAGLGCSAKYPGGILLLPVVITAVHLRGEDGPLRAGLRPLTPFLVTVVAVTPGLALQPGKVVDDVLFEWRHYGRGHYNYSIEPGLPHLREILRYLASASLSAVTTTAIVGSALAMIGLSSLRRAPRIWTLLLTLTPVLYILYFAGQRVMIVRNLLVLLPFLAVLAALGVGQLWTWLGRRGPRVALLTLVGLLWARGAWALHDATATIRGRPWSAAAFSAALAEHLERAPSARWYLSPGVAASPGLRVPAGQVRVDDASAADYVVVMSSEIADVRRLRGDGLVGWIGPREVNLRYYPSWRGDPHIMIFPADRAPPLETVLSELYLPRARTPRLNAPRHR